MLLEVKAQVEERFTKHSVFAEEEGDHEPAKTSVAVEERMDGFKLHMCQRGLQQHGGLFRFVVQEEFKAPHAFHDLFRRRWHEDGVAWPSAADPVLAFAEMAGHFAAASTF